MSEHFRNYALQRYVKMLSLGMKPLTEKSWKEVMEEDGMSNRFIVRANEKINRKRESR